MKSNLTAAILYKNEETRLEKCLYSLSWCAEIIIIDDRTLNNTKKLISDIGKKEEFSGNKIKHYERKLNGNFSEQRNYALSLAGYPWVLFIDADEIVTKELKEEIINAVNIKSHSGYFFKRQDNFLGKWLKYGETGDIRLLRLGLKESGKWHRNVHETWDIKGTVGFLNHPILHYSHQTVGEFLAKLNFYTSLVAQSWIKKGRRSHILGIIYFPLFKFIWNYFFKKGFLDGVHGFVMAAMMSFHSFQVRSKVYLDQKK